MNNRRITLPSIVNVMTGLAVVAGIVYTGSRILKGDLEPTGLYDTWVLLLLFGIYLNGQVARMIHMSRVKVEHVNLSKYYEPSDWWRSDLGLANFVPLIMEFQYQRNLKPFVDGAVQSYEDEGISKPLSLTLCSVILKARLVLVVGVSLVFNVFGLPRLLNDYTLYRGLDKDSLIMIATGISVLLLTIILIVFNYTMFDIVENSLQAIPSRVAKKFMLFAFAFSVYVLVMLVLTLVLGITGVRIPVFKVVFNTNMVNLFISITPFLNILQAFILKGKVTSYQYLLNDYLG